MQVAKHLFIDEILNVWQHIQNGEHKEDEEKGRWVKTEKQDRANKKF